MKTLLKWVLPAFLGIVPALGMDQAGIIDDPFFVKEGTACSISRLVEVGTTIKALVTATDALENKTKLVEAMCAPAGWQNNDTELFAQERVKAQVLLSNGDLLEKEHAKALRVPYTLVKETEGRVLQGIPMKEKDSLPVGEPVEVSKLIEYQRPDGTIHVKSGEMLYELLLEETRVPGAAFRYCQREWEIFSQLKRKTRHQVQTYNRTDVTLTTYRIPVTGERIELSKTVRVELKPMPGGFEPEVPTCGEKALPAGAVIVS